MNVVKMADVDLSAKRVLIREDLNVPVKNGEVTSDARIRACLPTIKAALAAGAELTLMSHLGRPDEGSDAQQQPQFSLAPVALRLSQLLNVPVDLKTDYLNGYTHVSGHISLLENVRFNQGEKNNNRQLAQQMAKLCDVYVMDAFGTAHRAQASTHGITEFAATACAGPLLVAELEALSTGLENPASPRVAVVGGSKVSTKLSVLNSLSDKMDQIIVGGGIANTFIAAAGYPVGNSLFEESFLAQARQLMKKVDIPLPIDVVVATEFSDKAVAQVRLIDAICDDEMILDIGPETAEKFSKVLQDAGTIIWNGPVGVFEIAQFSSGTKAISDAIAKSLAFSIAGGGDTLAAIDQFGVADGISYISTGGGAFLEYVEGKTLPAVAALQARANDQIDN